ncbi:MAG: hypothetical protein JJT89_07330 [Nitriliruptoraceae bacterium]|nr:hypothetical protein [Nitriliruptoraceae bacterium]
MPPLGIAAVAAAGVVAGILVDQLAKRRTESVDDYHDREFEGSHIPVAPNPPFGN